MNAPAYPWANRQREAAMAICPAPLPCPFCGGTELVAGEILDARTEGAEEDIPTWCCDDCGAQAPARVWNNAQRADGHALQALRSLRCWAETGQQFAIDWHRRWGVPLPDFTTETTDALEGTD